MKGMHHHAHLGWFLKDKVAIQRAGGRKYLTNGTARGTEEQAENMILEKQHSMVT